MSENEWGRPRSSRCLCVGPVAHKGCPYHANFSEPELPTPAELDRLEALAEGALEPSKRESAIYRARWQETIEPETVLALVEMARAAPRWIPVGERLPEPRVTVLAVPLLGGVILGYYDDERSQWNDAENELRLAGFSVTHWMPLPEPPK